MQYNKLTKVLVLECSILPVILNLHYFKRDSNIFKWMSCLRMRQWKAEAYLRLPTQLGQESKYGNRHSGIRTRDKTSRYIRRGLQKRVLQKMTYLRGHLLKIVFTKEFKSTKDKNTKGVANAAPFQFTFLYPVRYEVSLIKLVF